IDIWVDSNITGLIVGTFYVVSGYTLKCRASEAIPGTITAGSKVTKVVSITVGIGDYIGLYFTAGYVEREATGYAGMWLISGKHIDPDDEATYGMQEGDTISLGGFIFEPSVSFVSGACQYIWNVRSLVSDMLNLKWNVTDILSTLVSKTLMFQWNVRAFVSDTLRVVFSVRSLVNKTNQYIWNVRTLINKSLQTIFNVRMSVNDTFQSIWHVRELVNDTVNYKWNVLDFVSDTLLVVFNVRSLVNKTNQYIWNVLVELPRLAYRCKFTNTIDSLKLETSENKTMFLPEIGGLEFSNTEDNAIFGED
ncbi:hypothetical protein LCGC14_1386270, partial [marine sediment metagenome]